MSVMRLWDGREVPRIGLGCWAIGGPNPTAGGPSSYGQVDDTLSRSALRLGYERGARVFDTAAGYGAGHSETLVGEEISHHDDALIITKFSAVEPEGIRQSIDDSRRRLRRDCIDLMLFHVNEHPIEDAAPVFDTLQALREEGKIAAFGWSTDWAERANAVADLEGFVAVENDYNVFTPAPEMMAFCEQRGLVSISRMPLAMGLLTGKFAPGAQLGNDDIRASSYDWLVYFKDGKPSQEHLQKVEAIRDLLMSGGRSLAQGALSWILAKSQTALPVPGFKNEAQVMDNLGALDKGPLPAAVMDEISAVLSGS